MIGEGGLDTNVREVWNGGKFLPAVSREGTLSSDQIIEAINIRTTLKEDGYPESIAALAKKFKVDKKTMSRILGQDNVDRFYRNNDLGDPPNMQHFYSEARRGAETYSPTRTDARLDEIVSLLNTSPSYKNLTKDDFLNLPKEAQESLASYAASIKNPSNAPLSSQNNRFKKYIEVVAGKDANRLKGISGKRKQALPIFDIISNPEVRSLFPKAFEEISIGGQPLSFDSPEKVTAENVNRLNMAIAKHYGQLSTPKSKYGGNARDSLVFHKAREFATNGAGWNDRGDPSQHARNLAKIWYSNLNLGQHVEFEVLWDRQQMINKALRTEKGQIQKSHQQVLHHPQWLSKGGETSYEQDYNWELLPKWRHDVVHADKIWSDRKKRDEMIKKFSIMNLRNDPDYLRKSWEGTAWD